MSLNAFIERLFLFHFLVTFACSATILTIDGPRISNQGVLITEEVFFNQTYLVVHQRKSNNEQTTRDDEELRIREEIGLELLQAIEQSNISIPIISKGYAAVKWYLNELGRMAKCERRKGRKIMSSFYDVAPLEYILTSIQAENICGVLPFCQGKTRKWNTTLMNLEKSFLMRILKRS